MAMQNPILFTGRELNFEIPASRELNAAADRLNAKLEKKEDLQRKLQDELRKGMRVDSQVFVSDFARKQQFEAITDFENKWTQRMRERGNKLTNDDLIEMENDKAAVGRLQSDWLSSQKLWERDDSLVQKSPGDFDVVKHAEATKDFLTTGKYQPNSLEFSGIDMASYFDGEKWTGSESNIEDVVPGTGFNTFTKVYSNATEQEAKDHIVRVLFGDKTGRALKGVVNDFMQLPQEEKIKWLSAYDKDKNKIIDEGEVAMAVGNVKMGGQNMLNNPIVQWAQQRYLPNVLKTKKTSDKQRAIRTGTGTPASSVTFTETMTNPDGSKGTITYKGAEAQAKIDEAKAKKGTAPESIPAPWDDASLYTPPKESNGSYSFDALAPLPMDLRSSGLSGTLTSGKDMKLKQFVRKYGQPTVTKFTPPDKFILESGGTKITVSKADIDAMPDADKIYGLQINTGDGVVTIADFMSGATKAPAAELDPL